MFGYDPDELERYRKARAKRKRDRPIRVWVVLLMSLFCVLVGGTAEFVDRVTAPRGVEKLLGRVLEKVPVKIYLDRFEVLPKGSWSNLSSWTLRLYDLKIRTTDPKQPDFDVAGAYIDLPRIYKEEGKWVFHMKDLAVYGLLMHMHKQRPPPPWEPSDGPVLAIRADRGLVYNMTFWADEDAPLPELRINGITGAVNDLEYKFSHRELSMHGSAVGKELLVSVVRADQLEAHTFVMDKSNIFFQGRGKFGNSSIVVDEGTVKNLMILPKTQIHMVVKGADLGDAITRATGQRSPVEGILDGQLTMRAGGELPRGKSIIEGDAVIRRGRVILSPRTRYIILDAIRILPWVKLNAKNEVVLERMDGGIRFSDGVVELHRLHYPIGKRELEVNGRIGSEDIFMMVRLNPIARYRGIRPGIGMILEGPGGEQKFRIALRDDLMKDEPWIPLTDADRERLEEERRTSNSVVPAWRRKR